MIKVHIVDLATDSVADPVIVRAHQTMTVGELKKQIEEEMGISALHMRILLERYYYDMKLLEFDHHLLKQESFFRSNKVFVEGGDNTDYQAPIDKSAMFRVVDKHINAVRLNVTLPSIHEVELSLFGSQHHNPDEIQTASSPIDCSNDEMDYTNIKTETNNMNSINEEENIDRLVKKELEGDSYVDARLKPRIITIKIDKRLTITDFKNLIQPHLGVSPDNFKLYRVYANTQEFEFTRPNDTLNSLCDDLKIVVKLGRALKVGEYRTKLFVLDKNSDEPAKPLMDTIVSKCMTVKEAKEQILADIDKLGSDVKPEGLNKSNFRLRKKTWKNPASVFFDEQIFDRDITVFNGCEFFIEKLEDQETMSKPSDLQIYIRRWRPSTYTLDPFHELILTNSLIESLKKAISDYSGIPYANIEIAKGVGNFPCEVSLLDIHSESILDWNPTAMYLNSWPIYLHDDGGVFYFRDKTEDLAKITDERKQEIVKSDNTRMQKMNTSCVTWVKPKEKALKIFVKENSSPTLLKTETIIENLENQTDKKDI